MVFLNAIDSSLVHVQELGVEAGVEPVGSVSVVGLGELQPVQLDSLLSLVHHIPNIDLRFLAQFTINLGNRSQMVDFNITIKMKIRRLPGEEARSHPKSYVWT